MKVRKHRAEDLEALFAYWNRLGEKIPYFFAVTSDKWRECMFEDKLDNEAMFLFLETFVAEEHGRIVGFTQYGRPAFAWNEKGQKYQNPQIGIIRHFYFETNRFDVAELLFAQCESYMGHFPTQHAFYHIFGMSCNANHGKLHESLAQVGQFLCEKDYQVEHENQYYSLALKEDEARDPNELQLAPKPTPKPNLREYEVYLQESPIGKMQIRFLEKLTGGATADIVYMTWIGINESFRRQGWGSKAMKLLSADLHSKGYRQLHLDTASTNERAKQFYEHYGFQDRGKTSCFIKTIR